MRHREAQRVLHWLLYDPYIQKAELMVVVNTKHKRQRNTKEDGGEEQQVYIDYVLKKEDMIKLLKLHPKNEQKRERI
jgi:hypothetical protein